LHRLLSIFINVNINFTLSVLLSSISPKDITMHNLLDPAILFFFLGVFAGAVRSNLEIPQALGKFLSLYLLMAIGLKGGFALAQSGFTQAALYSIGAAMIMAIIIPTLGYNLLKRLVSPLDAAAIAASYGSISAVTFIAAMQFLENQQMAYSGHMVAAMVLMETPAILMAVILANILRKKTALANNKAGENPPSITAILRESLTNGSHILLIGSLLIGYLSGDAGKAMMQVFTVDIFKGLLAFFMLDMGLFVAKNAGKVRGNSVVLFAYATLAPLVHAAIALLLARFIHMNAADALLLMVLSASASYIVVPAVVRYAIPEANASLYFGLPIGITFPFNIVIGIPLYMYAAQNLLA
jgi:hypothetical protein